MVDKELNYKNTDIVSFEPCQFVKDIFVKTSVRSSQEDSDFYTLDDIAIILILFILLLSLRDSYSLS